MQSFITTSPETKAIPLHIVHKEEYNAWLKNTDTHVKTWLESTQFKAEKNNYRMLPGKTGQLSGVIVIIDEKTLGIWSLAHLPCSLPPLTYGLPKLSANEAQAVALGWQLACYKFDKYKKQPGSCATLQLPKSANANTLSWMAESINLARDLINTPANDMGPTQLGNACIAIAKQYKAKYTQITGDALLEENYPLVYTVGKASPDAPRLIDIRAGKANAPKVTLVGKGVCFDTGGLDIKSSGNMKLMKKDMGGAAVVLALTKLILAHKLDIRLRVLIPIVENAVSGNAMRPLDIVRSRSGKTVEIGNTDAEGRLILCDALAEADSEKPDLLIDCATLTGAARVATGVDIPAFFTPDDNLAAELTRHGTQQNDPLWRLPLWKPYRDMLNSRLADISNDPDSGYAGAITAALYLQEFVPNTTSWIHIDMMAWNTANRPGRPTGGEAQALRALFALLEERYG